MQTKLMGIKMTMAPEAGRPHLVGGLVFTERKPKNGRKICDETPEIFKTDHGAQFTSTNFIKPIKDNHVAISMDERGRRQDNMSLERLRWTLKHHYIYLHSFDTGKALRQSLALLIR